MRRAATAAVIATVLVATAGCNTREKEEATPTPTKASASSTATADVSEHESGPQSPILYGLEVPKGATQLGPLVRYRSEKLIATYQPELDVALAAQEAAAQEKLNEEAEENGTTPPTPTPTPTETATPGTRPSDDTFKLLEDPPTPDVTISIMRVDGSPTEVLRRMIAQINAVLPEAKLDDTSIAPYCSAKETRIVSCTVKARGMTNGDRDIQITVSIDPGDIVSRTARVASKLNPAMVLKVQYLGDPREGQVKSDANDPSVPKDVEGEDTSGLIWPRMDVEAPVSSKQLDGWVVPTTATTLLSGRRPQFVALSTDRVREADTIAREYAERLGTPDKDVVEDLNEISTTYSVKTTKGATATATFVLSGRGSYVMIFYTPAP